MLKRNHIYYLFPIFLYVRCGSDAEIQPEHNCLVDPIRMELVKVQPSECGEANGFIEVKASGGEGMLVFSIDAINFQSSGRFEELVPEDYVLTTKDEKECTQTLAITLESSSVISFSETIRPIIDSNCAVSGCHVSGEQAPDMTIEANIFSASQRIKTQVATEAMPFGDDRSLQQEEIESIICWFVNGAKNN